MHVWRFRRVLLPLLVGGGASLPDRVPTEEPPPSAVTFQVGEKLIFNAKVSALNAGKATISVEGIEKVRGIPTFHTIFDIRGRILFKKFANHYESWFDTTNIISLRHSQQTDEGDRSYEFFPDKKVYV